MRAQPSFHVALCVCVCPSDQQARITVNCFNDIFASEIHELKRIDIVFLHVLLIHLNIAPSGYLSE